MLRDRSPLEIIKENERAIAQVEARFSSLNDTEFPLITFDQIKAIPVFQKYEIGEGIWAWRLESLLDDGSEIVYCEFPSMARLRFHKHDCFEIITVIDGEFDNMDDKLKLKPYKVHDVLALTRGRLIVKFFKE